jgi:MoxR-like ATPase
VFDKSLLFEMSYALMRRFAFIEVPAPADDIYQALIRQQLANDDTSLQRRVERILMPLLALRNVKELGPSATFKMPAICWSRPWPAAGVCSGRTTPTPCDRSRTSPRSNGTWANCSHKSRSLVLRLVGGASLPCSMVGRGNTTSGHGGPLPPPTTRWVRT